MAIIMIIIIMKIAIPIITTFPVIAILKNSNSKRKGIKTVRY